MILRTDKGGKFELDEASILANNPVFAWEYNPHRVRLWIIGHEFGAVAACWADCESDALDEAYDADLLACFAVDEADADEDAARLGNAGEPCDLTYAWLYEVDLSPSIDGNAQLLCKFAEARGAGHDTLAGV